MKLSSCWAADFETTTESDDCRVWAFSMSNIQDHSLFLYGTSIEEFFDTIMCYDNTNLRLWFHNLKFDGYFIISYLMKNGYRWIKTAKECTDKTFTTLITDDGQYYSITVWFTVNKHKKWKVTFFDSLKIFPNFSVENIAKGFNLPIRKLEIDYRAYRSKSHKLTEEEIAYIRNDVEIMSRALKIMFEQGHTKMTIASDAMSDFRARTIGFRKKFPLLPEEVDNDIRKSYRGGFTYVNDTWKEKEVGAGITLDVNSLYPYVLKSMPMPCSQPAFFEGEYEIDETMPLYVQCLTCKFELKPGKIPCIQLKNTMGFIANEYVKSSHGDYVELMLTKPDYELFREQYDVEVRSYNGGWKFMSGLGLFDDYVNHWIEQKIQAGKDGNAPLRQISKLLLNSLYGRFGIAGKARQKMPYLDEDGIVKFITLGEESRQTCFIPVACFVTAYGRNKTIRTSQAIRDFTLKKYGEDRYYYSDTDSIHASLTEEDLEELKDIITIDDFALGAWAKEAEFTRGLYIRQKCYIEEVEGKIHVTVAGLPKYLAPLITFDNFRRGFSTEGMTLPEMRKLALENGSNEEEIKKLHHKLTYTYVPGGVILADTDFTIK